MATAAARLLRVCSSRFPRSKPVFSNSSFADFLRRSRLIRSAPALSCLRPRRLPQNHPLPFQSLYFCSAASAEDTDGDPVAGGEFSAPPEERAGRSSSTTYSAERHDAGPERFFSDGTPPGSEEPPTAQQSGNARFQKIPMKKGDWICPQCNFMNFARNFRCLECKTPHTRGDGDWCGNHVEMKSGDWACSRCGFMNSSRNGKCLHCKADIPASGSDNVVLKKGDWYCSECNFMNFAKNVRCLQCNAARHMKPGDWICAKCQFYNFSRNSVCCRCQEARPQYADSSDWSCPSCKYHNFGRNLSCLKCNFKRPINKSELGLSTEAYDSRNASPSRQDSLLFSDKLFGESSKDEKRNSSASDDDIYKAT